MTTFSTDQLLSFFKVMADESRLKIIGLLAQQPRSVEELATLLGLGSPTVSHHLGKLQKVGLVQAQAQQYYNVYSLNQDTLQNMGAHIANAMKPEMMMNAINETRDIDHDAFEKRVIEKARHNGVDGKLAFPSGLMHQRIVLRWIGRNKFELGKRYTEEQVEDILERGIVGPDTNHARRYMVDEHVLNRNPDGSFYWRADTPVRQGWNAVGLDPDALPLSDHQVSAERLMLHKVISTYVRGGRFVVPETNDDDMQARVLREMWKALRQRFNGTKTRDEMLASAVNEMNAWSSVAPDKTYTETQVDAAIAKWAHGDPARVRHLLVEHGYLVFRKRANVYVRADAGAADPFDVLAAHTADDRVTHLPDKSDERKVVLRWLAEKIPLRKRFSRDEVDAVIDAHKPAGAAIDDIRNALLQEGLLDRKGATFWRAA